MPIRKEPQPNAVPSESPLESEPLAQVYAQQVKKKQPRKNQKVLGVLLSLVVITLLSLVILKIAGIKIAKPRTGEQTEPTPTATNETITGPVNQYATHSATRQIEEAIQNSEEAFRNIRFREDAYLPPTVDLNVSL